MDSPSGWRAPVISCLNNGLGQFEPSEAARFSLADMPGVGFNGGWTGRMAEIEESSKEITQALGGRAKILAGISLWAKIGAAVGALGIALSKALSSGLTAAGMDKTLADATGAGLQYVSATLVFIAAIIILVADDNASKLLAKARIALDRAKEQKDESENQARQFAAVEKLYETEVARLSHLQAARDLLRAIFEDVAVRGAQDETEVIKRMLLQARRQLFLAHGFEMSDFYTICVYERVVNPQTNKAELICRAHIRSIDCDVSEARPWQEGVGAAGVALARREEIIISDLTAPDIGALYGAMVKKADDDERYRSIVAEPISLDGGEPWGMVVATSSVPEHFSPDDRSYVDVTQSLAGMVSLAIKLVRAKRPAVKAVAAQ
jgi:hypothetical protein